jgi:hypothetical protein
MKNSFAFLLILLLPVISCKKESDLEAAQKHSGKYAGTYNFYINDGLIDPNGSITIDIEPTGHGGEVVMNQGILSLDTGTISGNKLSIKQRKVSDQGISYMLEYGNGNFSGDSFYMEFHQDIKYVSDPYTTGAMKWKAALKKQ